MSIFDSPEQIEHETENYAYVEKHLKEWASLGCVILDPNRVVNLVPAILNEP